MAERKTPCGDIGSWAWELLGRRAPAGSWGWFLVESLPSGFMNRGLRLTSRCRNVLSVCLVHGQRAGIGRNIAAVADLMSYGAARERVKILGVPMDCVSMAQAVVIADEMLRHNEKGSIIAINPEKIVSAGQNPDLLQAINEAALLIPDGIGAVLAARLGGASGVPRVPGADLMPELCSLAAMRGYPVFLFGARPEVTPRACAALRQLFPGIKIAGYQNGYLSPAERSSLVDRINASGARLLFVGLGSPQQELWMRENLPRLTTVNICQGVGGTLDVLAGRVKRAPVAWQKNYMEWLYRILTEPSRIRRFPKLVGFAFRVWKEGVVLKSAESK